MPSSSPTSINADRYLLKVLRRARHRFIQYRQSSNDEIRNITQISIDNQSDSGIFTSSSKTNFNEDVESNSLLDIDEDYLQPINANDPENELLCQSLEAALMKTLLELRQLRSNCLIKDNDEFIVTRF
jgi:hypothetical protein